MNRHSKRESIAVAGKAILAKASDAIGKGALPSAQSPTPAQSTRPRPRETVFEGTALLIVLALAAITAYHGLFSVGDYFLPTYDNSMLHAGRARVVLETGHWAETEMVFGGLTPTYHVPFAPVLFADTAMLSGMDLWWAIRLFNFVSTMLLALAFYVLVRSITGDWKSASAASVLALTSQNLMSWGTRTTPISLGVILVLFVIYCVHKRWIAGGIAGILALAMDHPPSLVTALFTLLVFCILVFARQLYEQRWKLVASIRKAFDEALGPILAGILGFALYLTWHVRQAGLGCIDFKCLPQAKSREFGANIDLIKYFNESVAHNLAVAGIILAAISNRITLRDKLLLYSFLLATLILIKNDALGLGVFTERFLTYFDEATAILAGIAIGELMGFLLQTDSGKEAVTLK